MAQKKAKKKTKKKVIKKKKARTDTIRCRAALEVLADEPTAGEASE